MIIRCGLGFRSLLESSTRLKVSERTAFDFANEGAENRPFVADPSRGLIGAVDVVVLAVAVDIASSLLVVVLVACSMCSEQHCTCDIFRW